MTDRKKIADAILGKAAERGPEKSTCPSEIAREIFPESWRDHMKEIRDVAIGLSEKGKVIITQKREKIDTSDIKGPIRITIKRDNCATD